MSRTLYYNVRGGSSESKEGFCIRCSLRRRRGVASSHDTIYCNTRKWGYGCLRLQQYVNRNACDQKYSPAVGDYFKLPLLNTTFTLFLTNPVLASFFLFLEVNLCHSRVISVISLLA